MALKKENIFIEQLRTGTIEKACITFQESSKEEQHALLNQIADLIRETKSQGQVKIAPKMVTVLHRDLQPGNTYQDFLKTWAPPGADFSSGQHSVDYFDEPTQVINGESVKNPKELISIGLVSIDQDQLPIVAERYKETEALRRKRVAEVTENGTVALYKVLGIYTLGR